MVWVLQDAELWPIEQWVAHQGVEKLWYVYWSIPMGSTHDTSVYTVPANKKLYLCHFAPSGQGKGQHMLYTATPTLYLKNAWLQAYASIDFPITPPVVLPAGCNLRLYQANWEGVESSFISTIQAYELDV